MCVKRCWKLPRGKGASGDEVARLQQQVEEVERAGAALRLFVAIDGSRQLLLQQRRELGVGVHPELIEMGAQRGHRVDDACPRQSLAIVGAATVPGVDEGPVPRQRGQPRLPSVVVHGPDRLLQPDLLAHVPGRRGVEIQVVAAVGG